jgi:hypothetical protein
VPQRKLLISVDYELFFGARAGSVERSLLAPTEALAACLEREGCKLSLFVDAGFLVRAREEGRHNAKARAEHDAVSRQLEGLASRGHDLQLHVHPHWQDCRMAGDEWRVDTRRYRLHDFEPRDAEGIVRDYKAALESIKGAEVFAYRAGGWCLQPFAAVGGALRGAGIWLDSTIYAGGYSEVPGRGYDFRAAPALGTWRFDDDPLVATDTGWFLEVPISACRYGVAAFWTLAWRRFRARPEDRPFGDGAVMPATSRYYLRRLAGPTWSPVSIDRTKAGALGFAYSQFLARSAEGDTFNVMGHPKSLTPRGIGDLGTFLRRARADLTPVTYRTFDALRPSAPGRAP